MSPPVSFDVSRSLIFVEARIWGKHSFRIVNLALDTGASTTIVASDIMVALGYDPAKSTKRTRVITGSGVEYRKVVTVSRLEALGKPVDHLDVICHDLPEESKLEGLLGLNFLRHFDISVRYSDGTIALESIVV